MEVFNSMLALSTVIAPVVLALVQLIKQANLPKNSIPFLSVVIGLLIGLAAAPFTPLDWTLRLWAGGVAGLAATGLFELVLSNRPGTTKE